VHSMVEFSDGATVAQLSCPDMRLPIGYALAYPDRLAAPVGRIDWARVEALHFETPDTETFPCLGLAYEAGRTGGTAPAWLNGANEVANAAFLGGRIAWCAISEVIEEVLAAHDGAPADSIDAVVEADGRARRLATAGVERRASAA
ncbi:MAG: 1-deoxy-D-xylulose-5-phosphate reductoisomerase, partial [Acidimicrobiales bacterium]